MSEAEPSDLLLVDKRGRSGERLKNVEKLQAALSMVGSAQNVLLSRLARSRRVLFVEGDKDYKLLRMFARQYGFLDLASGLEIMPVPSGGFGSWNKVVGTGWGIARALDNQLAVGAIYDRDYFSDEQITSVQEALENELSFVHIHKRKEIENYLLLPDSLDRALLAEVREKFRRLDKPVPQVPYLRPKLEEITELLKEQTAQARIRNELEEKRRTGNKEDLSLLKQRARESFGSRWSDLDARLEVVCGKDVLSELRSYTNATYGASLTDYKIISAISKPDFPADLQLLLNKAEDFRLNFMALKRNPDND